MRYLSKLLTIVRSTTCDGGKTKCYNQANVGARMRLLVSLTLLIGVFTPCETFAGFISFTDRTEFLNAATGAGLTTTNENFSTDPGDPFTIDDSNGNSVQFDITSGSYIGAFEQIVGSQTPFTPVSLSSTSVTGSVAGIGFDAFFQSDLQPSGVKISLNGGAVTINSQVDELSGFLGLLSTDGMQITSVDEITLDVKLNDVPSLDNLVIATGDTTNPVPEPSSLALLGIGLCGLFGYGWRRRKKQAKRCSTA